MSNPTEVQQFIPTHAPVSDFLNWQRAGQLDLNPPFQRRSVWKPGAKSFLVDTVVRGLPVPLVFVRERLDLLTGSTRRDVIDGQQRLRTLMGFIDPSCLDDYSSKDFFEISRAHNAELAGRTYTDLPTWAQTRILSYRLSVQILPEDFGNAKVLEIFARLNSTGQKLTPQELRNAAYFGEFKTCMYELALEQTERWLGWRVYNSDQLSRMAEVEMTSDLAYNIVKGLSGKNQARLDSIYKEYDEGFPFADELSRRFRLVMAVIDEHLGDVLAGTVYSREVHFFTLFTYIYDVMFGLGEPLKPKAKPSPVPLKFAVKVLDVSRRFREYEVPPEVLDAVARASADIGRRRTRLKFLRAQVG